MLNFGLHNLGRWVKWEAEDGGWCMGQLVLVPDKSSNRSPTEYFQDQWYTLVREFGSGVLTWVPEYKLVFQEQQNA